MMRAIVVAHLAATIEAGDRARSLEMDSTDGYAMRALNLLISAEQITKQHVGRAAIITGDVTVVTP